MDSIRVLALPDGRPVKCIEYDSFGNVAVDTKPEWRFPLGFARGLNEHYTGFVRFGFRDYDPRFGRFTARDPLGDMGGDHDLWEYCVDDPVGCLDPDCLLARGVQGSGMPPRSQRAVHGTPARRLPAEQQKYLEDVGRGLGLGTGAVVDGILHMGDMAAAPLRAAMNYGNSLLDGNPNYFQPTRGNITDKLGLPKPRNEQERRIYAINETASSALTGAGILGGTQAGAAALEHAGRAAGAAAAYAPTAMNAARSAAPSRGCNYCCLTRH